MNAFHTPVMADQCLRFLAPQAGGVYVDATLGGGGHALAILAANAEIRLYGFDQDDEALAQAGKKLEAYSNRCELIKANFSRIRTELALRKVKTVDGILFDLGVSSHQLDEDARGFSFDADAPLDMRMDRTQKQTVADALRDLTQAELTRIFKEYGEDLNAGRISKLIVSTRESKPIQSTADLSRILEKVAGIGTRESLKTKVRIFQSLRIYVNRELEVLEPALQDAINILKPGARIVVLSYHSLEDRIVKNVFRAAATGCACPPQIMKCVCGKQKSLKLLCKGPLTAEAAEVGQNIRSRSAKLRAAEKIKGES